MRLRPKRSHSQPPTSAPTPAEMAFELNAPIRPTKSELSPKSSVQSVRPAAPATIEPASM
jgi:hypothetical protein